MIQSIKNGWVWVQRQYQREWVATIVGILWVVISTYLLLLLAAIIMAANGVALSAREIWGLVGITALINIVLKYPERLLNLVMGKKSVDQKLDEILKLLNDQNKTTPSL